MARTTPELITDIVRTLVAGMSFESKILDIEDLGNGQFKITVCETFHAQSECTQIMIGTEGPFQVNAVENNKSITFTAPAQPTGSTFKLDHPYFTHGTRRQANLEMNAIKDDDKWPFIYLWEPISEQFPETPDGRIERNSTLRILFASGRDATLNTTDELYDDGIAPMWNLVHQFIYHLKKHRQIGDLDVNGGYTISNYAKLGKEDADGAANAFFDQYLTGLQLTITIPVWKKFTCLPRECDC